MCQVSSRNVLYQLVVALDKVVGKGIDGHHRRRRMSNLSQHEINNLDPITSQLKFFGHKIASRRVGFTILQSVFEGCQRMPKFISSDGSCNEQFQNIDVTSPQLHTCVNERNFQQFGNSCGAGGIRKSVVGTVVEGSHVRLGGSK